MCYEKLMFPIFALLDAYICKCERPGLQQPEATAKQEASQVQDEA